MNNCLFIDTSALFKRYVNEKGTYFMDEIFSRKTSRYISSLSVVEVISNLRRLVEVDNILSSEEFNLVVETFFQDISSGELKIIETNASIILGSLDLCLETYITPIDALQLATVLENLKGCVFVCSDKRLLKLAKGKGIPTLDPEEMEGQLETFWT